MIEYKNYKETPRSGDEEYDYIKFVLGDSIGKGSFGSIFYAYILETNVNHPLPKTFAWKKIQHNGDEYLIKNIKNAEILWNLFSHSKSLIHLYWAVNSEEATYLFFHFHNGRDLGTLIWKRRMSEK